MAATPLSQTETTILRTPAQFLWEATRDRAFIWHYVGWGAAGVAAFWYALGPGGLDPIYVPAALLYGFVWWTFFEYLLHRYVMHWRPANPRWRAFREYMLSHDGHHRKPDGRQGTPTYNTPVIPMLLALPFIPGLWLYMPLPAAVIATYGGCLGYLAYEVVHFAAHRCFMPTRWEKAMKRRHMHHHYRDENKNFGIITSFWDKVFGTYA